MADDLPIADRDAGDDRRVDVLIWSVDQPRLLSLSASVAGPRVRVAIVDAPAQLQAAAVPPGAVGLVDLGPRQTANEALPAIRALNKAGIAVIACGDGLSDWPIGERCRALLAGAQLLADSNQEQFAEELRARVLAVAEAEARLARGQEEVRVKFERLGIIGRSDVMRRLFHWTARIGRLSDLHTLITGETGTGKELFANAIHQLDPKRRHGPFVAVNCGAISPGLAEAELFGHRRGAFTGAERERKGLIRASDGGVLLLDEIGEMDLSLQAKVLRVIQEGRVLGVGEDHEVAVDVRVIAATHRNLEEMVARQTFRADLFHRLTVLSVHIPPLREHRDDIAGLVDHFIAKHEHLSPVGSRQAGQDLVSALSHAELPGNAREIENAIRHAIVHNEGEGPLGLSDLPAEIWSHVSQLDATRTFSVPAGGTERPMPSVIDPEVGSAYLWQTLSTSGWSLSRSLESCERSMVEGALRSADGNQSRAARLLGLTPRSVYNKLRKYRLSRKSA